MLPLGFVLFLAATAAPPPPDDDDAPLIKPGSQQPKSSREQDDDDDEGKAQPNTTVVITGRKLDVARTQINPELGATVYSLGNDAIEDRPGGETSSMAVMLAQTPGVTMSGDRLTIRGSKPVQVRINDVILPEAVADPADHLSIRLAQTTRVMTGTLPAQYGFVPAGVISVTTKNGLYRHGGELEAYVGSNGFTEPAFEWAGSVLETSVFASGSRETNRMGVADLRGNVAQDRSRELEGLAFMDRILGASDRVSLIVGGSQEHHGIGETSLPRGTEESGDRYAVGTLQHSVDEFTAQTSLFFGRGTDEASYAERTHEHRSTFGTQIDASSGVGGSNVLRGGVLLNESSAQDFQSGVSAMKADRASIGAYLQDEWKLSSQFTFNPGVRVEWLTGFSSQAQAEPRASFVWTSPTGVTAHVGYARYASVAPLDDFDSGTRSPIERDDYVDAGAQYRTGAFTLSADAYVRSAHNFLAEHHTIGSALTNSFAFKRARLKGVELSATFSTHSLSAWANLSLSQAKGRELVDPAGLFSAITLAAAQDWISLPSERPVTGSAGLTWRTGKLALSGTVTSSSGAVRSPALSTPNGARARSFATAAVSAVYHAGLGGRLSDLRVDVTNLADRHYLINDGTNLEGGWTRSARGRTITVGVEQGF
jgi:hypothetical protein